MVKQKLSTIFTNLAQGGGKIAGGGLGMFMGIGFAFLANLASALASTKTWNETQRSNDSGPFQLARDSASLLGEGARQVWSFHREFKAPEI